MERRTKTTTTTTETVTIGLRELKEHILQGLGWDLKECLPKLHADVDIPYNETTVDLEAITIVITRTKVDETIEEGTPQ